VRRALAFLTPLPVGATDPPDRATLAWFPVVGALIGTLVGAVWWGAERVWPPAVAAALVVIADLALTGMLHLDGLMDSADGLLPHLDRDRRLEVMSEPGVGAFAVAIAIAVIALRVTALASMTPSVALLAGVWCASRTGMAVIAGALPYAREHGLASGVLGGAWRPIGLYGLIASVSLGAIAGGRLREAAVATVFAGALAVALLARRRIGGFTGDVLGAAGVIGETVALVIAAARW
jgi:adenosylcobinamide-GDP ribazoletransferase